MWIFFLGFVLRILCRICFGILSRIFRIHFKDYLWDCLLNLYWFFSGTLSWAFLEMLFLKNWKFRVVEKLMDIYFFGDEPRINLKLMLFLLNLKNSLISLRLCIDLRLEFVLRSYEKFYWKFCLDSFWNFVWIPFEILLFLLKFRFEKFYKISSKIFYEILRLFVEGIFWISFWNDFRNFEIICGSFFWNFLFNKIFRNFLVNLISKF